jgi:hypothetical protein
MLSRCIRSNVASCVQGIGHERQTRYRCDIILCALELVTAHFLQCLSAATSTRLVLDNPYDTVARCVV